MNTVTTGWKYLLRILAKASIYVTEGPSCHVLYEKISSGDWRRWDAVLCTKIEIGGKPRWKRGETIGGKSRWNRWRGRKLRRRRRRRRRRKDRRRENAAIVPCSPTLSESYRPRIDTTSKSTRSVFSENEISAGIRRRREKLLQRQREWIVLLNRIGRTAKYGARARARYFIACLLSTFSYFRKLGGTLIRFRRRTGLARRRSFYRTATRFVENRSGYWSI